MTRLLDESPIAFENIVHGTSPVYAYTGYGIPWVGTLAILENSSVKAPISRSGCRTAHTPPSTACLYRTFTSRQARM